MDDPLVSTGVLIVSLVLLWKGADLVIHAASRIAHRYGLSDLVIGMTVVAVGTSAPEVVVTLLAATGGEPDIALSNVVGSNVFNIGFIMGATAILGTVPTPRVLARRDAPMLLFATVLLFVISWDLDISRWEATAMLIVFALYLLYLFRRDDGVLEEHDVPSGMATWRDGPLLFVGCAALVGGGDLLVESASALATAVGVSSWLIGVTVVAAGTSAPECATCIVAALRGRHTMAAGNLIGSDLFNILGILGLASFVAPLNVDPVARGSILLMVCMMSMLLVFIWSGWRLTRFEGLALIGFALMRWTRDAHFLG